MDEITRKNKTTRKKTAEFCEKEKEAESSLDDCARRLNCLLAVMRPPLLLLLLLLLPSRPSSWASPVDGQKEKQQPTEKWNVFYSAWSFSLSRFTILHTASVIILVFALARTQQTRNRQKRSINLWSVKNCRERRKGQRSFHRSATDKIQKGGNQKKERKKNISHRERVESSVQQQRCRARDRCT